MTTPIRPRAPRRRLARMLFLGACVAGWGLSAAAQGPLPVSSGDRVAPGPAADAYSNWLGLGLARPFLEGDPAQFRQRYRMPSGLSAGVEDLHVERFLGARGLMTVDGRALFENRDYQLRLRVEDPEVGFARAGFRNFRTWYDASGGFYPSNGAWFAPVEDDLAMDRGEGWVEGALALPALPRLTLKYTRLYRKGEKPSLSWGESNLTGLEGPTAARSIVPSFWESDEVRDILEGTLRHTAGATGLQLGLRYQRGDINNTRNMLRRPTEPQERYVSHQDSDQTDLINAYATTETRLHRNVLLTTLYAFTTMSGDVSGSRIYGANFGAAYDPLSPGRQYRDSGFLNLVGTSEVKHHTAGVNLRVSPWSYLTLVPTLRVEKRDLDAASTYVLTYVGSPPALEATQTPYFATNERGLIDLNGGLEARYTGLRNWVIYGRGDWLEGKGDLLEREYNLASGDTTLRRLSDDRRYTQKYLAGATWYPLRQVNLGVQLYRRHRKTTFEHPEDPRGPAQYSGFRTLQDFTTDDVNLQLRWRLLPGLSLASRYDYQRTTFDAASAELARIETGEMTNHVVSQSVTWAPLSRYYVQGSVNYVRSRVETPANDLTEAAAGLVPQTTNDYVNASLAATYVVTERAEVEAQYFFYLADNYVDNSEVSQPFGAGFKEHGVAIGVALQPTDRLRWVVRYHYFINEDTPSGHRDDYDLQLVYSGLQYRF